MMNFQPLHDYVVIERTTMERTAGGLLIPESATQKNRGKVLAVGPGKISEQTGSFLPIGVAVGDTVLFNRAIELDGGYLLVRETEILCKIV